MNTLLATRSVLLLGDYVCLNRFYRFSKLPLLCSKARFLSNVNCLNAPLTLESLGLKCEIETLDDSRTRREGVSTVEIPRNRVKRRLSTGGITSAGEKRLAEVDTAIFAAKSFSELGLARSLVDRLGEEGFTVPTDVQATAIPVILESRDVVVQSYTGSGKTLAYLLPILSQVGPFIEKESSKNDPKNKMDIQVVIVAPSRELGMQIVREVEKLLGPTYKKLVQQLVGGANRSRQEEALRKNKPAIVVGTPGRIAEISAAGKLQTHYCRFLVLDEIDELLAFNFRADMQRILEHVGRRHGTGLRDSGSPLTGRAERQTIMVSATVPFSVIRAARSWAYDPLLVQAKSVVPLGSLSAPGSVNLSETFSGSSSGMEAQPVVKSLPPNLEHYYCVTRIQHKVDALRRCVHALNAKSVIAFMNHTKQLKDTVFKLEARGMQAAELHGDLSKLTRSTILKSFRNGEVRVLLTSELSARGLDIPECDLVVNLELPTDSIHYAHRAGRTGRLGRKGTVVTICEEREVFVVRKLQKQLGLPIQACNFAEGKLAIAED